MHNYLSVDTLRLEQGPQSTEIVVDDQLVKDRCLRHYPRRQALSIEHKDRLL
jgi:hypothetical protein